MYVQLTGYSQISLSIYTCYQQAEKKRKTECESNKFGIFEKPKKKKQKI